MAYYLVDIDNLPSQKYAGRVFAVHRSLDRAVDECRVRSDRDGRTGMLPRTIRIIQSELDFKPAEFVPPEDIVAAFAVDGTRLK